MNASPVEFCDEEETRELEEFLVNRIYAFNAQVTGYFDARLLGGRVRAPSGETLGAFNGHTWGGCCVVSNLWVDDGCRGQGLGRLLLQAVEAEAMRRGCAQIVLSTHSFQAPAFYEQMGYLRLSVIYGQPKGYADIVFVKRFGPSGRVFVSGTSGHQNSPAR
jgi:GNAT superfamily N-acetyltransferase